MDLTKVIAPLAITCCTLMANTAAAEQFEFSAMFGQMYSSDLVANDDSDIDVDSGSNIALGIAWQKDINGQGQILFNKVSHDFTDTGSNIENSLDITYAHFNGVALFRQQNYVTTFSLGLGAAYFDAEHGAEELYPSASIAVGTRYEFSDAMALVTEIRAYASLIDEDDEMFCQNDNCTANFDDSLWLDTTISIGVAIKF